MTQEQEDLVLKDLTSRLTYGIKAHYKYYDFFGGEEQLADEGDGDVTAIDINLGNPIKVNGYYVEVEYVKPYLRSMDNMSENECKTYNDILKLMTNENDADILYVNSKKLIDFLNEQQFDYRGLIEKGLALEAPKGMYN